MIRETARKSVVLRMWLPHVGPRLESVSKSSARKGLTMDSERFDAFTRTLRPRLSRRGLTSFLICMALGGIGGLQHQDDTSARRRRRRRNAKNAKGIAKPSAPPASTCSPECGPCQFCGGGTCYPALADTPCQQNGLPGLCLRGVCNPKPGCAPRGTVGCFPGDPVNPVYPNVCCSGICPVTSSIRQCVNQGSEGYPCHGPDDCTSGRCRGYRCACSGCIEIGDASSGGNAGCVPYGSKFGASGCNACCSKTCAGEYCI